MGTLCMDIIIAMKDGEVILFDVKKADLLASGSRGKRQGQSKSNWE